jgi:hypothetical protein
MATRNRLSKLVLIIVAVVLIVLFMLEAPLISSMELHSRYEPELNLKACG